MKTKTILLALFTLAITSCKKGDEVTIKNPIKGTKWQLYEYFAATGKKFYKMDFNTETEMEYYIHNENDVLTPNGKSILKYSIDDPTKTIMRIHVTGIINGLDGKASSGASVDYYLDYKAPNGDDEGYLRKGQISYRRYFY